MSFILQNYSRASVSYNKDSFTEYNYIHPDDTVVDINADDYFLSQQRSLNIDDIIEVQTIDAGVPKLFSLKITGLVPNVTTTIVIQSLDEDADVVFNTLQLKNLNGADHLLFSITNLGQEPQLVDTADLVTFNGGIATGPSPDASAVIQSSSTTGGWLPPRMTTAQRDAIAAPFNGLFVYNTDTGKLNILESGVWKSVTTT
jgi:hypothetical protein